MSTRSILALLAMQWGLQFSTGAISEAQEPLAEWLEPLHDYIGETIRQAPVVHADETTHFQGAQWHWLWVLCSPQLAFFLVHAARCRKAAKELLGDFAGVLITDRHGAAYRAATLQGICARLDIPLIYCRPYAPEGKGKLERWHRTFRDHFLAELDVSGITDLDDLNGRLWAWIEQVYH